MIGVKLIGAGGYGGLGMIELLLRHPKFKLMALVDVEGVGRPISAMWPYLKNYCDLIVVAPDTAEARNCDAAAAVCATPDGVGQAYGPQEIQSGRKFLDYSGDYRFNTVELYREYATRINRDPVHKAPDLLRESAYGLTELHRAEIAKARVVGNPGCFAMSCILGLAPAIKNNLVEAEGIICDCKTGVSGAGKKAAPQFHYPERYDAANAYRLTGHQHVMEIERELSALAGRQIKVAFTPQVVPMARGIISTLYGRLGRGVNQAAALAAYRDFYQAEPFVRVQDLAEPASTANVRGSNRALLTVACDERSGVFRVISHIDNLVKGQAGSALQNLNVMFGLDETLGLNMPGPHP